MRVARYEVYADDVKKYSGRDRINAIAAGKYELRRNGAKEVVVLAMSKYGDIVGHFNITEEDV